MLQVEFTLQIGFNKQNLDPSFLSNFVHSFSLFLNGSEYNQNGVSGDLILAIFNLKFYIF